VTLRPKIVNKSSYALRTASRQEICNVFGCIVLLRHIQDLDPHHFRQGRDIDMKIATLQLASLQKSEGTDQHSFISRKNFIVIFPQKKRRNKKNILNVYILFCFAAIVNFIWAHETSFPAIFDKITEFYS
jgi:hypothetical protein